MKSIFTWEDIARIKESPQILGHLAGFKDLTDIHGVWIKKIHDAKTDQALMASRGSYKTTSVVIIGTIYHLLFDPDITIFIVRKTFSAASDAVKAVLSVMESPTFYALCLHCWFADKDNNIPNNASWRFSTRKDGTLNLSVRKSHSPENTITALGLDSSWQGKHCDLAVCDDTININDRLFKSERLYTNTIMGEIRANIVKKTGYTAIMGTRWAADDYWSVLEAEGVKIDIYPYQVLPFISEEDIARARATQSGPLFSCNYELRWDNPEDCLFSEPYMGEWHRREVKDVCAHLDAAFGGADSCALSIAGRMPNGKFNVVGFTFHGHVKDWTATVIEKMRLYGARKLYIESNADHNYTMDAIVAHPIAKTYDFWPEPYVEKTNKQIKISTVLFDMWNKLEFAEETDPLYLDCITSWSENVKDGDDSVDSLASLLREAGFAAGTNWMALYQ